MERGLYTAGTAMLTLQKQMDVVANNFANVQTVGFKEDSMVSRSFNDMLISRINDTNVVNTYNEVGPHNLGIHVDSVLTNFVTGSLTQTDKKTDMAIDGDGFFVVQTPQGERYTRNGEFAVTRDGILITNDGYAVMGENGIINVGGGDFTVNTSGDVMVDGEIAGRIRLVSFADNGGLRKEGNNLYNNFSAGAAIDSNAQIRQYMVESSNVSMVDNVVDMMTIYRNYESNQKVIQIIDGTLNKAANDLGKI